ncbi:MAG: hypothetical protein LBC41_05445 [Clostridiales bacterium]|nr:hypothetical protein [Clostridiales bacterium]MDR2750085.1 hypothetical protein [Clostridiales bacterium]
MALANDLKVTQKLLETYKLKGLMAISRGSNIVIVRVDGDYKSNVARFKQSRPGVYILNIATSSGKWEDTPFEGYPAGLMELLHSTFPWVIESFDM